MKREKFIEIYSEVAEIQKQAVLKGIHWFDLVLRYIEENELACFISIFRTGNGNDDDYASFVINESTDEVAAFRIINNLKGFVCL